MFIEIRLKKHYIFERDGDDLHCAVPISFSKAALGCEIEVPTLGGKAAIDIPEGTQTGKQFRLRGKGIKGVRGAAFREQKVPAGLPRGGLLTQASILKVAANGTVLAALDVGYWGLRSRAFVPVSIDRLPNAGVKVTLAATTGGGEPSITTASSLPQRNDFDF